MKDFTKNKWKKTIDFMQKNKMSIMDIFQGRLIA